MPLVLTIAPSPAFCYQRDMGDIAQSSYAGTERMSIPDPYGTMTAADSVEFEYVEPAAPSRPSSYAYDKPFDRKAHGKLATLRSLRNPHAVGGDNRKAAKRKIARRLKK